MITSWKCRPRNNAGRFWLTESPYQICPPQSQQIRSVDVDDEFARQAMSNFGAFILGRNMFGPVRGRCESSRQPGDLNSIPS
jgi:hypothetical protein